MRTAHLWDKASKCHDGNCELSSNHLFVWKGKAVNAIVTIGIDLAKNVFAAHGVVTKVKPVLLCASVPCIKLR